MAKTNLTSILDRPSSEAQRPPAVPTGDYLCVIFGLPSKGKSEKKGTDYIEYNFRFLAPIDGTIDEDELADFEASPAGPIKGKESKKTFYLTDKSEYRHEEFMRDDLGVDTSGKSHWENAQQTNNHQFIAHFVKKPTDDGKGWYSEMTSTAPAE